MGIQNSAVTIEKVWQFLIIFNMQLLCDPEISLPCITVEKLKLMFIERKDYL